MNEQLQYVRDLENLDIYNSLVLYTTEEGYNVNRMLRGSEPLEPMYQKMIDDIDTAFLSVPPLQAPLTVYRSLHMYLNFTYASEGYLSTSTNVITYASNKPVKGAECCVIEITVPAGSKALPVFELSTVPHEKEILLPRGGSLLFVSESIKNVDDVDYLWLYATYAPHNPNFKVKNVRQITQKQLKALGKIFDEDRIQVIIDETKSFGDTFEDFKRTIASFDA